MRKILLTFIAFFVLVSQSYAVLPAWILASSFFHIVVAGASYYYSKADGVTKVKPDASISRPCEVYYQDSLGQTVKKSVNANISKSAVKTIPSIKSKVDTMTSKQDPQYSGYHDSYGSTGSNAQSLSGTIVFCANQNRYVKIGSPLRTVNDAIVTTTPPPAVNYPGTETHI